MIVFRPACHDHLRVIRVQMQFFQRGDVGAIKIRAVFARLSALQCKCKWVLFSDIMQSWAINFIQTSCVSKRRKTEKRSGQNFLQQALDNYVNYGLVIDFFAPAAFKAFNRLLKRFGFGGS